VVWLLAIFFVGSIWLICLSLNERKRLIEGFVLHAEGYEAFFKMQSIASIVIYLFSHLLKDLWLTTFARILHLIWNIENELVVVEHFNKQNNVWCFLVSGKGLTISHCKCLCPKHINFARVLDSIKLNSYLLFLNICK